MPPVAGRGPGPRTAAAGPAPPRAGRAGSDQAPGRSGASRPPSPLRTARATFTAYGSSMTNAVMTPKEQDIHRLLTRQRAATAVERGRRTSATSECPLIKLQGSAGISHQGPSRGARGCKARGRAGAQAYRAVRRAPGPSVTQQTRADRAPQQESGEKCGLEVHFPIRKGVLRHTVGAVKALDGIDLTIPRGQILALVGESGCDKTPLSRAMLRLVEPTAGQVLFDGTELTGLKPRNLRRFRRHLEIAFQDPMSSFNPRLTVAGTLTEPMQVHGIGADRDERLELAAATLAQVQLERDYLWRYPHEFSGGQRQRIGIARALVLDPELIVCDEVTSALDVSVQAEILQLLLGFQRDRGLTLLFITHNIGVVEYVSNEMAVMRDGQIVEQGPTGQVAGNPQHAYTQKLLAAVPRVALGG